jgi:hypothetical protein
MSGVAIGKLLAMLSEMFGIYFQDVNVWCSKRELSGPSIFVYLLFQHEVCIISVIEHSQTDKKSENCDIDSEFNVTDEGFICIEFRIRGHC